MNWVKLKPSDDKGKNWGIFGNELVTFGVTRGKCIYCKVGKLSNTVITALHGCKCQRQCLGHRYLILINGWESCKHMKD